MIAGVYFTGTGPILILTTYETLDDPQIVQKLAAKGIKKFIAFEVTIDKVKSLVLDFIYHYQQSKEDMFHQMI